MTRGDDVAQSPGPTEPKWGRLAPPPCPPARPSVGTISISALPTCQGESVHRLFDAQSRWRLTWVADRSRLRPAGQGLVSYHLKSMVELTQCHTPFRDSRNEASICVPMMFNSHVYQQYDKQMPY
jgi:hypothetical protein